MAGFQDWLTVNDPERLAAAMAEQFRLSQKELEKAQAALQPAFALALQNAMASPAAWSTLATAFSAAMPGKGLPGVEHGTAFLETVFGSDALTQAIARQASLFAGIAPDTMQKLMPGLALLGLDAMMRQTMAQIARNQPEGLATGDFGGATAEMMRRGANAVEALSRPSGTRSPSAPFADAFATMAQGFGWNPAPAPAAAPPTPEPFNPMMPFASFLEAFGKNLGDPAAPPAPAPAEPPPAPAGTAQGPYDAVGSLLRSGQKMQEDYAREMALLFDRHPPPGKAS